MTDEILLIIGERIREKRQEKNITLESLAIKAGVTKGLISQIENNRTVPSLPVLLAIIYSLDLDIKVFFENLQDQLNNKKYILIRHGEEKKITKEPVKGFTYQRILAKTINSSALDLVLLEIKAGAVRRKMVTTEAFEIKYMLKGSIEYQVEQDKFSLEAGDSLAFDGRLPHRIKNTGKSEAVLLVIYLF